MDYAYGWQMTDGYQRIGKEYKALDVGESKHSLGTSHFSHYISHIIAAKPNVLFLNNFGKDQVNSIKQVASYGLKKKIQIVCPILLISSRMGAGEEASEGVVGGTSFYWELDHPTAREFVQAFRKTYGRPPIDYAGYSYSGVKELLSGSTAPAVWIR